MREYKIAAFDLDDTLLDENKQFSKEIKLAISGLIRRHITVVLATGRHYLSARQYAAQLGIEGYLICYNGAMIRHSHEAAPVYVSYLEESVIRQVAQLCRERSLYLQMYDADNNIVVERIAPQTLADPDYYTTGCVEVEDFRRVESFSTPKMMIYDEPDTVIRLLPELQEMFGDKLHLTQSKDYLLEMMNPGVQKGASLAMLCRKLGVGREFVIAFGDNSNDLEMLRWAGTGVAVGNCAASLREVATYIAKGQRQQGVLEVMELLHLL